MLPDADGFDLLAEVKRLDPRRPVLVLTARAADEDRITALSQGAANYVTKPFNLQELILRVRALLRRSGWGQPAAPVEVRIGAAVLRSAESTLERDGESHLLTELELSCLTYLWGRRGQWVTREELLVEVWGYHAETLTRTVDIFVSRLRRMLGDSAQAPKVLLTKRGTGYMIAAVGPGEGPG